MHIVVNVEHWLFDNAMPRKILTAPHGLEQVPDIPNYSWAEYGMRAGMPRILRCLAERSLPASVSLNAGVIEAYPSLAAAMREAGWEFIGHGLHQKSIQGEADESALIAQSLEIIRDFTGSPPAGWLGPGQRETFDTPDILKSLGVEYVFDWVLDDLPCWMRTKHGPLLSLPYTLELNDSVILRRRETCLSRDAPQAGRYAGPVRGRGADAAARSDPGASPASYRGAAPVRVS